MKKSASTYSTPCKPVKTKPKKKVKNKDKLTCNLLWQIMPICANVKITPEDSRTVVFNKGTEKGFKIGIPIGGHQAITIEGAMLE
jgi:hypothetical protein